ncbi:SpoIIE family protein phosphatase [Streptomyces litchfieldiae]|uniref:SpoIIE family protein phosphatase n=1 Tax=Streptomyces litchfieldiae TaxID=3075543 RepID=A0ABU2MR30_9ACTN|nr:SpoIIE family protein phosphatase [Streptomyces sp. DSM 44938]MDT0343343.1 SpoIIE family protein phosphatase [Streptomyces sp. DSM 44938]
MRAFSLRGSRGRHALFSVRSIVGQMFILQVVLVSLLVVAAALALVLQSRQDKTDAAFDRSLGVAQTVANAPGTREALVAPDPTAVLQPRAEAIRKDAAVDFVVVMDPTGIRYTHPKPDRIGKRFVGTLEPARRGEVVRESIKGTIGPLHQVVVPVENADGDVIGLVSAGVTVDRINLMIADELPIVLASAAGVLALATGGAALVGRRLLRQTRGMGPREITRMYEHHDAVLHAVREGVLILDEHNRLLLANDEARRLLGLPPDAPGRPIDELGLDRATVELLSADREVTDEVHLTGGRLLAVNHRPMPRGEGPPSSVTTLRDTTEMRALSGRAEAVQRRLSLLYTASVRIGTTLEVARTAEELTEVAVPDFADFVTVDLAAPVLRGEVASGREAPMRRAATGGITDDHPLWAARQRVSLDPKSPQIRGLASGQAVAESDLAGTDWWRAGDEEHARRLLDYGIHSLIAAPLHARGMVLGVASFWRSRNPEPFDTEDLSLAEELAARTAVCVDNARRYTREHDMAATLQSSLLPRGVPEQNAVEAAYRYRPAQAIGGDFFDVIPLSGARVALVVGDVVGHGLHAAATMGRLRTAVHNFAALDLPPDELLGRLSELADRDDRDESDTDGLGSVTGATCLYAIYDPVEGHCTMARAGHLPPALVHPDGRVEFPELSAQPPLGVAAVPFETAELRLAEGSRLVLYTDGLVEAPDRDIDEGLELLRTALTGRPGDPEEMCDAVLGTMLPAQPRDDVALLIASTRVLPPDRVASWDVPVTPASVTTVRAEASRRLASWGLEGISFITELILTELITNAIRHASGPIRLRLLLDRALICEVSDSSSTSPHLRRAATTDEGGRGLFLVAQYAEHWGTRYTATGKIIWAEQRLPRGYPV